MNHIFPWLFPDSIKIPWLFPDFLTFFQNSLTFPWLEKVVSFFQVFQCRWEPCKDLQCQIKIFLALQAKASPCDLCYYPPIAPRRQPLGLTHTMTEGFACFHQPSPATATCDKSSLRGNNTLPVRVQIVLLITTPSNTKRLLFQHAYFMFSNLLLHPDPCVLVILWIFGPSWLT